MKSGFSLFDPCLSVSALSLGAAPSADEFVRMLLWDEFPECCGQPVVGAEYMGQQEMICCGCPEPARLSDAQIVASLRERFPSPYRIPGCGMLPDGGYECVCGQCAPAEPSGNTQ